MSDPILIAGGGLGGLSTALALGRKGRRVRVFEQAQDFGAIGYGIQLGPNVFPCSTGSGISEAVKRAAIFPRRLCDGSMPIAGARSCACRYRRPTSQNASSIPTSSSTASTCIMRC